MNGAHLHLLLNHLPVLGVPFGIGLGAFGLVRRDDGVVRAALGVLVLAALAAWLATWSGEGAESVLEAAVSGVSERAIHDHEEWAERASVATYLSGALALGALGLSWGKALRRGWAVAALALALVPAGLMAYAANLGGQIRHTEIVDAAPPRGEAARPDRTDDDETAPP